MAGAGSYHGPSAGKINIKSGPYQVHKMRENKVLEGVWD